MKISRISLFLFFIAIQCYEHVNCGSIEIALSPISSITSKATNASPPRSCLDLFNSGQTEDGLYTIYSDGKTPLNASCDMTNGGWTLIAKRDKNDIYQFSQSWNKYKHGFGSFDGSFWIGLQQMHSLTKRGKTQLRIDVSKGSQFDEYFIVYDNFVIGPEDDFYRLHVGSKVYGSLVDYFSKHAEHQFSTFDKGNEKWKMLNCPETHNAGWWFDHPVCYEACLTCESKNAENWYNGDKEAHKNFPNFEMKIMPVRM